MTASPTNLLERLPNELLAMIKDDIGDDLLGNVCFYQLSRDLPRLAALYEDDEPPWELLCRMNGIGILERDEDLGVDYRMIALETAEHALACTHPGCGVARLEDNGEFCLP